MRFEPEEFLAHKESDPEWARVSISPYPALISSLFVVACSVVILWVDTLALPTFLRALAYGIYFFRIFTSLWFLSALWAKIAGKIDIGQPGIQGANMPYRWYRPFFFEISDLENVSVSYGLFGRAFGYGTICLSLSGIRTVRLPFIKDPLEVKKYIDRWKDSHKKDIETSGTPETQ